MTAELMHETVDGRQLTDGEIVSILRNWTAGDLGSIATSIGVVIHFLASHGDEQDRLRSLAATPDGAPAIEDAIEEILRIDDPFVSSRRLTTREVEFGGETILAGARVVTEEVLRLTTLIELCTERPAVRETPPVGGWVRLPVVLR